MEGHLRKITRCLGRAVAELERVSASEKIANEQLDEEWMARFFAGIAVPAPSEATQGAEAQAGFGEQQTASVGEKDLRWTFLKTKWLPLLQDLYRTVGVLDREESALQALEQKEEEEAEQAAAVAEAQQTSGGEAKGGEGTAARKKKSRAAAPPRPPKGLLSLRDYTVIHAALEVVVHWGLVPVLEAGVGVFEADKRPRSRAVKISRRVLHYWSAEKRHVTGDGPSPPRRRPNASSPCGDPVATGPAAKPAGCCGEGDATARGADADAQLALCTEVVQGVVTSEQFMPMLMPLYLPDLLAARLQLVFGRTAVATAAATAATAAVTATPASALTVRDNDGDERAGATATVADGEPPPPNGAPAGGDRHRRSPPPAAVTREGKTDTAAAAAHSPVSMMPPLRAMLQDAGPRQVMGALRHLLSQGTRAPPWLRQRAGRILSEIVLRPGGVQATLEVYLAGAGAGGEGGGGDDEGEGMKACLRVAKLLATPPKRVASGVYVSRVAPQLAEMLHFDGQQRAVVTRVVAMIVGRLSESMPGETRRLILVPLLRPLLLFWGPTAAGQRQRAGSRSPAAAAKRHTTTTTRTGKPEGSASPPVGTRGAAASATTGSAAAAAAAAAAAGGKGGGGGVRGDDVVSSEEALERCLEDLEKLLTAAPAPASLLGLLSGMGVTVPLFRLHCFCATAKSRNLQSTKACLSALLPSSATAASDLVAGLLPVQRTGWGGGGKAPRFSPGPTGGTVLRAAAAAPAAAGGGPAGGGLVDDDAGSVATATEPHAAAAAADGSLLGMEAALEGLGLDPETLRLIGSAAAAAGAGGGAGAGLVGALAGLKEAEGRARAAAELLEGLGEGSPVAGKVFDMLLRRYLSLRDGGGTLVVSGVASTAEAGTDQSEPSASAAAAAEQHAVMASVVVLAERLGARVFGTGMQMLSCIRLVLEHEQPPVTAGAGRTGGGGGDGYVDAAERVAQMEEEGVAAAEGVFDLGSSGEEADGDGDNGDDTLCSVVLALLTTVLELGEEERKAEEEAELRAMLGPLKGLAAGHRSVEVAEMSALLSASILSRGLSPEERREERERVERVGEGGAGAGAGGEAEGEEEARAARMMSALDAAEEDLRSEAVPLRARGVVTLTRLMRATLDGGPSSGRGGGGRVNKDTAVAERLMDTYARMAGDGDSYVYLAAVQGLAALADALPGWSIPRLVGIFTAAAAAAAPGSAPGMASGRSPAAAAAAATPLPLSQRLKIGEAVLLSARRCGDAMPKYAHLFVNAFVVAARERSSDGNGGGGGGGPGGDAGSASLGSAAVNGGDAGSSSPGSAAVNGGTAAQVNQKPSSSSSLESKERYHFRASCLSNLAEVCQLLRWSLGRFSCDVVDLAAGVLSTETGGSEESTLARRGASFLLGRVLRGAGGDVLEMVPAAELRVAYRALKRAAESDRDEVTRSHARNGLGCLDAAIRRQLFPGGGGGGGGGGTAGVGGSGDVESSSATAHHPGITVL